ncbi:exodeoxyribonuclease V subunit alpha [Leptospira levettii]|uniref:exodeoxyribonuclease V subunit alpha n=1 Tax=Leptospira levettii TaxID=2023178 RepID=UPI001083F4FB|nr:exodeoxyribonuclease V subunit alpha [Leptospira levettii]MCW7498320.1 exodeoxyribonuclease V subunit alpha [Leptospira levettii]TGM23527.1 exodeoxyribonuclease V subunit alpha [Leptospira levettii]TGM73559.1 exodeoxyribonuclease V subunit alpha [Leptospira levettii]
MKVIDEKIQSFVNSLYNLFPDWDPSLKDTMASLLVQSQSGDLYIPITDDNTIDKLKSYFPFVIEKVGTESRLYLQKSHSEKIKFESLLRSFLTHKTNQKKNATASSDQITKIVSDLERESKITLAKEQRDTIRDVITSNFRVISGGPGTGKTTVVSFLLMALDRLELLPNVERIALVAPTGRASQRLTESIQRNLERFAENPSESSSFRGQTIHNVLKINPTTNQAKFGEKRTLPYDLIIMDETSMVDLKLMNLFFSAIHFDTHIILLGDPNQLPSVGQGEVLTDLITTLKNKKEFLSELKSNHRFSNDSEFSVFAEVVKQSFDESNETKSFPKPNLITKTELHLGKDFVWIQGDKKTKQTKGNHPEILDWNLESMVPFLWEEWYLHTAKEAANLHWEPNALKDPKNKLMFESILNEYRCLTILRNGYFGIESIQNQILSYAKKQITNPKNETNLKYRQLSKSFYFEGMPIIIQSNDQMRKLFNGDIGLVVSIHSELRAVFSIEDRLYSFALDTLPDHEPAFFLTIHKSQGSEYKSILLYLPPITALDVDTENNLSILNRRILYTAITRAKERVILLGDFQTWEFGLQSFRKRYTGIQIP